MPDGLPETFPVDPVDFGKYQLLGRVGSGGMADVYLGRPRGQRRLVAIKCIKQGLGGQKSFVDMFIREGKLAIQLNHDAIVKTYEIGRIHGIYFICMEYIPGVDLSLLLRRCRGGSSRRLPVPHALHVALRICEGLHYAHELADAKGRSLNLVNRDVSPSNVRISFDGDVKLLDFGIAKAASGLSSEIGVLKGKISHMSPEQVRGLPLDRRSDIFAAAIVLHEMLTAEKLFRADSEFQLMDMVRKAEVRPPSLVNPRVSPDVDALVLKGLHKAPEERYQTADEMAGAIREMLGRFNFTRGELRDLVRELCYEEWSKEQESVEPYLSVEADRQKHEKVNPSVDEDYGEFVEISIDAATLESTMGGVEKPAPRTPKWVWGLLGLAVALLLFAVVLVILR
ncbi:MAG: serine/threonine protein kinase [Deltaproteobacteria bacterium]|nr:serine/threonine protein kinase [Deltaproteobacteria bacterium]